jgi:hypothetical protein
MTPEAYGNYESPWLKVLTSPSFPHSKTLFISLLNTSTTYDPVGWGVPYMGQMANDPREDLVGASITFL